MSERDEKRKQIHSILSSYIILQRRNVDRGRKLETAYTGEKPFIAF